MTTMGRSRTGFFVTVSRRREEGGDSERYMVPSQGQDEGLLQYNGENNINSSRIMVCCVWHHCLTLVKGTVSPEPAVNSIFILIWSLHRARMKVYSIMVRII